MQFHIPKVEHKCKGEYSGILLILNITGLSPLKYTPQFFFFFLIPPSQLLLFLSQILLPDFACCLAQLTQATPTCEDIRKFSMIYIEVRGHLSMSQFFLTGQRKFSHHGLDKLIWISYIFYIYKKIKHVLNGFFHVNRVIINLYF